MTHVTCPVSDVMCHMSRVTFHMSCVTCHVSRVTCPVSQKKRGQSGETSCGGSVINGATPSSFTKDCLINEFIID